MNAFDHVWFWRKNLPERKGDLCRVLARGAMNSIMIEFQDGVRHIVSRYAVRRVTSPPTPSAAGSDPARTE